MEGRTARLHSPRDGVAHGFGYCPEERKTEGIVPDLTVRENIVLALQAKRGLFRPLSRREQDEIAGRFIGLLDIRPPDPERPIGLLSGGNQQKVLLARWLAMAPRLLVLDEPTRGIDVGAHAEIIRLIEKEYNNKQIAEALFISERTVETHRKNIFRKTNTNSVIGLVKYAYEHKLV